MKLFRLLALTGLLAVAGTACADLEVTNLNNPDRDRAISTPGDVENLIAGAYTNVWAVIHYSYPGAAFSTAADAHSSSWGNWGMRDSGWEPRRPYNNDPSYSYNNIAETPWGTLYAALAAVRDGFLAIDGGIEIGTNGADTPRAEAFGKFIQGLAMSYVGLIFDKGFIVDEASDLENLSFVPYTDVHAAGIAKLTEAEQLARSGNFTLPSEWVGFDGSMSSDKFARLISSWRARLRSQVARSAAERAAVDWNTVMTDLQNGLGADEDYATFDDGANWAWARDKLHTAGISGWSRLDVRTYGPSDQSGSYQAWLGTADPEARQPFNVDTDDNRVTGGAFDQDGQYIGYIGSSPFPASRGTYHYSHYLDIRWQFYSSGFVGRLPTWDPKERNLLMAEAMYRTGNQGGAMDLVNASRANGGLAAFTDPSGTAPGARCVPRTASGACGDLLEALKYEKRIELFHYGPYTEFMDDRGWGDLVPGTFTQIPIPGSELLLLLEDIYTFGGEAGSEGSAPGIVTDVSPEGIAQKRFAMEKYREAIIEADGGRRGPIAH
ncbi:MAG: hypothetical protein HKO98_01010 [Gemmatimonadetes bacterium]|nr:hypothetical protein [Gemmatimonadota bacterium]